MIRKLPSPSRLSHHLQLIIPPTAADAQFPVVAVSQQVPRYRAIFFMKRVEKR